MAVEVCDMDINFMPATTKPKAWEIFQHLESLNALEELNPRERLVFERYLREDIVFSDLTGDVKVGTSDGVRFIYRKAALKVWSGIPGITNNYNLSDLLSPKNILAQRQTQSYHDRMGESKRKNWENKEYYNKVISSITGISHRSTKPSPQTVAKRAESISKSWPARKEKINKKRKEGIEYDIWKFAIDNFLIGEIVKDKRVSVQEMRKLWSYFEGDSLKKPPDELFKRFTRAI